MSRDTVSLICPWCEELIAPGDDLARHLIVQLPENVARLQHEECALRSIIGGLNHLKGRCTCCGGTEPADPPELTKRQAAQVALEWWRDMMSKQSHGG